MNPQTPYYKNKKECCRGVLCPLYGSARDSLLKLQTEMHLKIQRDLDKKFAHYYNDSYPVATNQMHKASQLPPLEPPDDKSIKTLVVDGVDERINEQDLRVNFFAHGEIETIEMVFRLKFALVTYKTRQGAEKAAQQVSNYLCIKGLWHKPPPPEPEYEASDEASQQAVDCFQDLFNHQALMAKLRKEAVSASSHEGSSSG